MVETVLHEIPVFDGLDRKQIDELSSWLQRKEFEPAELIIKEGTVPDGLYVLAKGTVDVFKESVMKPLAIAELDAPSVFGEMGLLLVETQRSASVRAKTKVIAGFLPTALFNTKLAANNLAALRIALNLGRISSERLRATTCRLTGLLEELTLHALRTELHGIEGRK
ncbi:MAG: cyclic nucleotide-binding domain-containing protein [Planctomycetota bacterium]